MVWWTATAVLGLAAAATIASVRLYALAVEAPVSAVDRERLVQLGGLAYGPEIGDPIDWWHQADAIQFLALYVVGDAGLITAHGATRWVRVTQVSGEFFDNFTKSIVAGRALRRADELANRPVAVVSARLWGELANGPFEAGDRVITVGGIVVTIVGVASPAFSFPSTTDIWLVRSRDPADRPATVVGAPGLPSIRTSVGWIATLRPGWTVEQCRDGLMALLTEANEVLSAKTGVRFGEVVTVRNLSEALAESVRPQLRLLLAIAWLMLGLCSVIVAIVGLLGVSLRDQEVAIRRSLGATSVLLSLHAWANGIITGATVFPFTAVGSYAFIHLGADLLHAYRTHIPPDISHARAVFLGSAMTAVAAVALVAVPAIARLRRRSVAEGERSDNGAHAWSRAVRLRQVLAGAAAAAACLLIAGALLSVRTLGHLLLFDPGYRAGKVVTADLLLSRSRLAGTAFAATRTAILEAAREAGLDRVGIGTVPVTQSARRYQVVSAAGVPEQMVAVSNIDGDYFSVLGIGTIAGDMVVRPGEVIINASLAAQWSGGEALGKSVRLGTSQYVVVGVVQNVRAYDQDDGRRVPELYRAFDEFESAAGPAVTVALSLVGHCSTNCSSAVNGLANLPRAVAGSTVLSVTTLSDRVASYRAQSDAAASVMALYSTVATGIAVTTVFALALGAVQRRTREFGIRYALGASLVHIVALIGREVLGSVIAGITVSVFVALYAVRILSIMAAPNVSLDWPDISVAVVLVVAVAVVSAALPVRAVRREPVAALLRRPTE